MILPRLMVVSDKVYVMMDKMPTDRRKAQMPGADDPILQDLERYWRKLRRARQIPARTDISPGQIDNVLPHAFILQRVAPGTARFRVAGQHLHSLLKMDARGMPFSTLFLPEYQMLVQDRLEAAFTTPAIVALPLSSPSNMLRSPVNGSMLLLPLRDKDGQTTRILGAIVTDKDAGARPRRFAIPQGLPVRQDNIGPTLAQTTLIQRQPAMTTGATALRLVVNNG